MNILMIGDVVGSASCNFLAEKLPAFKRLKDIDLVIVNGENSSDGNGVTPSSARMLFDSGADVITLGNHSFRRFEIYDYLDEQEAIIRPYNFSKFAPGKGYYVYDMGNTAVCVINLIGQAFMESHDCPFLALDEILKDQSLPKIKIVDFHAEATGEKAALAYYADGRVSAVIGTHTHVQTNDASILKNGTGFLSDVGMTGPINSILGVKSELIIRKLKTKMPVRFETAGGPLKMDCVLISVCKNTGTCERIEAISIR